MKKKNLFLMIFILVGCFNLYSQERQKTPEDYIRIRTQDENGNELVGIIVPGKPPDTHREPVAAPTRSSVSLGNVPAIYWSFGCSATSAAMAAGYYDNNGYPDMYTGPTNGGVMPMNNSSWGTVVINGETRAQCPLSATRNTVDGRTSRGHVDDYWISYGNSGTDPYITNGWTQHTYGDGTGDFMGTNQSIYGCMDGATLFYMNPSGSPLYNYTGGEPLHIDGCHGLRDFYESRGYEVISNYSQYIYGFNGNTLGFTFNQYKQEIDSGRPVIIQVAGHSMLGYGYDDTGNTVYLHDTWDYSNHSMTWGGSYSGMVHYGVCVVQLEPGSLIPIADFICSDTSPLPGVSVTFTDLTYGNPLSWSWAFSPNTVTYSGGTTSGSQNPQVSFDIPGYYTVSLTATNTNGSDTESKTNFVHAFTPGAWMGAISTDWNTASNWDDGIVPAGTSDVLIYPDALYWPYYSGNFTVGTNCGSLTIPAASEMIVTGNFTINQGSSLAFSDEGGELKISGDWNNNGTFTPGSGTVNFFGSTPSIVNAPQALITNYTRNTFTNGMTALTGGVAGPTGDDGSAIIPIGFTFIYAGVSYTNSKISTNGCLVLNQSGVLPMIINPDLFSGISPNTTLAPWWDNLADDETSVLYYKTEGTSPNRVFTAEWNRVKTYYSVATARISFQVKLFETTNIIEFHYGTLESGVHSTSESASIGIEDLTGGSGHFIEATTGSTTTGITNLISTTSWPTVNYRFTPPALLQTFNNITISKSSSYVDFNTNTVVEGILNLMPGATFKVINGKTLTVVGE